MCNDFVKTFVPCLVKYIAIELSVTEDESPLPV